MKKIILAGFIAIVTTFSFASFSLAQCAVNGIPDDNEVCFTNPLQYDTVESLLAVVLDRMQAIIVVLSLVFIVVGALLYITSAGNESRMTMAKGAITASLLGLAIGIAAPSFLHEIGIILGWTADQCSTIEDQAAREACVNALAGSYTLSDIALNVLNFLLGIVGIIAIIMLVAAGIMYLTSAGNDTRIETAKNMTKWSVIGIAIALGSLIIVKQIAGLLT